MAFKVTPTGVKSVVSTPFSPSITVPSSKSPAINSWSVPVSSKPYSDCVGSEGATTVIVSVFSAITALSLSKSTSLKVTV